VAGDDLWEILIRYKKPAARDAVGFREIIVVGIEFTDKKTGERFWAFDETPRNYSLYSGVTYWDYSLFVDMTSHPDAKLTGWSVIYGHLLNDGQILAVFDQKGKSKQDSDLAKLALRNRYSTRVETVPLVTIDLFSTFQGGSGTDGFSSGTGPSVSPPPGGGGGLRPK